MSADHATKKRIAHVHELVPEDAAATLFVNLSPIRNRQGNGYTFRSYGSAIVTLKQNSDFQHSLQAGDVSTPFFDIVSKFGLVTFQEKNKRLLEAGHTPNTNLSASKMHDFRSGGLLGTCQVPLTHTSTNR